VDVVSNSIVALADYSIALLLIGFIIRRRDLPLRSIFWMFGVIIVLCGTTEVLDVVTIGYPACGAAGVAKVATAIASLVSAVTLVPLVARAFAVPIQARLENPNREVEQAQVELARSRDEAVEGSRLKSVFLTSMSHELRTPLNSIIGFSQLLYAGHITPASAEYKQSLGDILSSARHLLSLINNVLDLAKVESGKMKFMPEPIEPVLLVEEIRGVLRGVAAQNNIKVDAEVAPELGQIVLDSGKLRQVLYNYLSNALKFSGDGAHVTIRLLPESNEWFRLEVEDNGAGIRADDLSKLFIEFHQLDSSSSKRHQGTGLGLALTRQIVEAQGGRVGVTSKVGQGSIFWAVLPRRYSRPDNHGATHS
jgi:signal transduction histidine kinase